MGPEWIVVAIVAVAVIFGVDKLPKMARNVGRAQSEFKKGMREGLSAADDDAPSQAAAPPPAAPPVSQPPAGDLPKPPEA